MAFEGPSYSKEVSGFRLRKPCMPLIGPGPHGLVPLHIFELTYSFHLIFEPLRKSGDSRFNKIAFLLKNRGLLFRS
ncbi:MAG: hypothetical protein CL917_01120 [Deltaproteobacteria bacterium]|nr:hypothetical protein [Deltaproteobacteria bacterium]